MLFSLCLFINSNIPKRTSCLSNPPKYLLLDFATLTPLIKAPIFRKLITEVTDEVCRQLILDQVLYPLLIEKLRPFKNLSKI